MKAVDIEALVRWAYREELPKDDACSEIGAIGYQCAWGSVSRYGEVMTLIDAPANRWGLVPSGGDAVPHRDAVLVGEAVLALDSLTVDIPAAWDPLSDLREGIDADLAMALDACAGRVIETATVLQSDGRSRSLKARPSDLVRRCAILGPPDWEVDPPARVSVRGANGRDRWFRRVVMLDPLSGQPYEIEVDGYDQKRQRPYADAYRRYVLDPDPLEAAIARAEYEVWHAALSVLAEDLRGLLHNHSVTGPARPVRPWDGEERAAVRILPDLRTPAAGARKPRPVRRRTFSAGGA